MVFPLFVLFSSLISHPHFPYPIACRALLGSCTFDGDAHEFAKELEQEVKEQKSKFKCTAIIMTVGSLIVHAPYIVTLYWFSSLATPMPMNG